MTHTHTFRAVCVVPLREKKNYQSPCHLKHWVATYHRRLNFLHLYFLSLLLENHVSPDKIKTYPPILFFFFNCNLHSFNCSLFVFYSIYKQLFFNLSFIISSYLTFISNLILILLIIFFYIIFLIKFFSISSLIILFIFIFS